MTRRTKKTIILSILGLAAIGISIGLYFFYKGPVCVSCTSGKKVSSTVLYQAFLNDSITARKEYSSNARTDKILEVSGLVTQVSQNTQNQAFILLKTAVSGASVNCTMEGPVEKTKEGDTIIIKGICIGLNGGDADLGISGDVYLTRCYITK